MNVLITGAGSGIGRSIAIELSHHEGNTVLLFDSCEESELHEIGSICRSLGASVYTYCVDVADKNRLKDICKDITATFNAMDLIFVNAGIMTPDTMNDARRIMDVNYFGAIHTVEEMLPSMLKENKGRIVFSNSIASLVATVNSGGYSASKAALDLYSDSLRIKMRGRGISVTSVILGFVDTPMIKGIGHAERYAVSPVWVASKMIQSALRGRAKVSIPFFRNRIWHALHFVPTSIRTRILIIGEHFVGFLHKSRKDC